MSDLHCNTTDAEFAELRERVVDLSDTVDRHDHAIVRLSERIIATEEQSTAAVNAMCDQATLRGRIEALEANAVRLEHRLDAIRDAAAVIDDRLNAHDQRLFKFEAEQIRHGARLNVHTDRLDRIDADITALEAHHTNAEPPTSDANPSEAPPTAQRPRSARTRRLRRCERDRQEPSTNTTRGTNHENNHC